MFFPSPYIFVVLRPLQSVTYQAFLLESNIGLVFEGKSSGGTSFMMRFIS